MCLCVGCTGPPGQTKNDTDLKFGTHTPLDHIQNGFSFFFSKSNPEGRWPKKNLCQMDFQHISSIALSLLPKYMFVLRFICIN